MTKKKETQDFSLGSVASFLTQGATVNDDNIDDVIDTTDDVVDDDVIDPSDDDLDDDTIVDDDVVDDTTDDVDDSTDDNPDNDTIDTDDDAIDLDELEPQITSYFKEKLYNAFGWEMNDDDKGEDTAESLVNLLQEVVEENSKPVYANDDIEKLNEFVTNGGNLRDYFMSRYSEDFDIENADLENQSDQERILREYFKEQGIAENKIAKRIRNYDDTGILQDEAEDALEWLKNNKEKRAEKLLAEQENLRKDRETQQQKFVDDVLLYIDSGKLEENIGFPLSKAQKDKLKVYAFKVGDDGLTEYQRKYNNSITANFAESVFLTTMREEYKKKQTKKNSSAATKILKEKLKSVKANPRQKSGGYIDPKGSNILAKAASGLK